MSQASLVITSTPPLSGPNLVAAINDALAALASMQSGTARPSPATARMLWIDTSGTPWLLKCWDGAQDIVIGSINASTNNFVPYLNGDPMNSGALSKGDTFGCSLAPNATNPTRDIDISAGRRRDQNDTFDLYLTSAITKRLDLAWAAGDGNGGRQSDQPKDNNTWYHVFLIGNPTSGAVDAMFSTSMTPTLPTGYTKRRRLGSIYTNSSSNIRGFTQIDDYFHFDNAINDAVGVAIGAGATVSRILSVPTGVRERAMLSVTFTLNYDGQGDLQWIITGSSMAGRGINSGEHFVADISTGSRLDFHSNVGTTFSITTYGWIDNRGKDY